MNPRFLICAVAVAGTALGQIDHKPPELVNIKVVPSSADVSTQEAKFTVELALKDDISGVSPSDGRSSYWALAMMSPSGQQERLVFNKQLRLTSGTPLEGVWSGEFTMPQASEPGMWHVQTVHVRDGAGNALHLDYHMTQALDHATFTVASTPADITPPRLLEVSFDPPSFDLSGTLRQVMVRIHATDDLSGVTFAPDGPIGPTVQNGVVVSSPSGGGSVSATSYAKWVLISGTPQDGVWQTPLDYRRLRETGAWKISQACVKDAVRNTRCYESELKMMGAQDLIVVDSAAKR